MALFYRIINNQLYPVEEVETLGWRLDQEHFLIPDESIERGEFVIHRTCSSIGDWGIISAMPRILKNKYPHAKVYVTSENFMQRVHGSPNGRWGMWKNPYENIKNVYINNPYVDGFIDRFDGEIYHDHFRIRDPKLINDPLVCQMLRFHGVDITNEIDYIPEIYFSNEEIEKFSEFKKKHFGDGEYGAFSFRWVNNIKLDEKIQFVDERVKQHDGLPFMYYTDLDHDFGMNKVLNADGLDTRLLLFLICNAKICTGTQTGIYDICSRYTNVDIIASSFSFDTIHEHYLPSIKYTFI